MKKIYKLFAAYEDEKIFNDEIKSLEKQGVDFVTTEEDEEE